MIYEHSIISIRSKSGEIPIEFSSGNFKEDLGENPLRDYLEVNRRLLENLKVSKIEIKITCNK